MKTKLVLMLTAVVVVGGCASFDGQPPQLYRTTSNITVKVDPQLSTHGWAEWKDEQCVITLRKYPVCLAHEVRHCLEGEWHPGRHTGEDC